MRDKIKLIIGQEDKRNPLTGEAIANELGTLRENITKVRIETGIPASSERRKERLLQEIQSLFYELGLVSDRKLAELLNQRGFKIVKFTVGQLHKSYPELWEPRAGDLVFLMDKGKFRRLGEAETSRESHPLIIAATTEDPESSLLLTFRRRIPMSIEIPSLTERPLEEKWQFIEFYLTMERERLGRDIRVSQSVLNCLLLAEFPGNIGQLKSDIQVCCAKAFLEAKLYNKTAIEVVADNFPEHLKSCINQTVPNDIRHLISEDVLCSEAGYQQFSGRLHKMSGTGIYEQLEEKYTKLLKNGIAAQEISRILQDEVETTLVQQIRKMEESKFSLHELSAIVGEDVLEITEYVYQEARKELPGLKDTIIFPMAIHIRASLDMTKERKAAL
ncbi:hypothetical protein [Lacrimispora sp.]|uniref:hypothetical protein n=1 Tax=Lacrimispora sp. TaxID=2719234 RepID=UPI0028AB9D1C|nr:hypothetical protein [Lacrimispora sp.]